MRGIEENYKRMKISNFKERRNDIVFMKQEHSEKKRLQDIKIESRNKTYNRRIRI